MYITAAPVPRPRPRRRAGRAERRLPAVDRRLRLIMRKDDTHKSRSAKYSQRRLIMASLIKNREVQIIIRLIIRRLLCTLLPCTSLPFS